MLAVDADSGLYGQITYSLLEGADSYSFTVDGQSGEIVLRNSLHEKVNLGSWFVSRFLLTLLLLRVLVDAYEL